MDPTTLAYIAGFLDGDGSIFFQLVRRKDYLFGFQVRCSLAFYQKTDNKWIIEWLERQFNCGYIRHRKTGISDYTVVEPSEVYRILQMLRPYVRLKSKHIDLGLEILDRLPKVSDAASFVELCHLVDGFREINYSKKRTINLLTPVETDPKGESRRIDG
jgi:hypothetical protein